MLVSKVEKLNPFDRLLYWIVERERIRHARKAGRSKPWTDDEILQSYRFCNVRRMDDKVSQWLLNNWYRPHFDHKNIVPAIVLARHFNKPETLGPITPLVFRQNWPTDLLRKTLRRMKENGETIFSAAYMVRGNGGDDKVSAVIDYTVQPFVKTPLQVDPYSMEKTWEQVVSYRGLGSFMAGQVVADLRWAMSGSWSDAKTWAPMGPGSKRGINRLKGLPTNEPITQMHFVWELREMIGSLSRKLPTSLTSRLEAIDWQNCLCEYDKYTRALHEGRRLKRRYRG